MSPRLPFRVHASTGRLVGATADATDAAGLVSMYSGGTIRVARRVVWREGTDHDGLAGDSYDAAAETILMRISRPRAPEQE